MTEQEQRAAIAEALGWEFTKDNGGPYHHAGHHIKRPGAACPCGFKADYQTWESAFLIFEIPDYLNDLNAIHEAWVMRFADGNERVRFSCELADVVARAWRLDASDPRLSLEGIIENATSRQRAEAFLRTIGKWRDE